MMHSADFNPRVGFTPLDRNNELSKGNLRMNTLISVKLFGAVLIFRSNHSVHCFALKIIDDAFIFARTFFGTLKKGGQ